MGSQYGWFSCHPSIAENLMWFLNFLKICAPLLHVSKGVCCEQCEGTWRTASNAKVPRTTSTASSAHATGTSVIMHEKMIYE